MKRGLLIILSGPSGVGKGTIRKRMMQDKRLNLAYSVSMTTRPQRVNEVHEVDYFFVSLQEFQAAIDENELIEWAEFVGHRYGTPKSYVEKLLSEGKNVLLEIEIEGASQVIQQYHDTRLVSIFLMPPSFKDLQSRIEKRQTESTDIIQQRLAKARREMTLYQRYQYVVTNDDIEYASQEIASIIHQRMDIDAQPS